MKAIAFIDELAGIVDFSDHSKNLKRYYNNFLNTNRVRNA